ncbi:mannosylglycerate hydrolase [Halanaerobium saccharolyticum]|jgi:mannosylglycerate hydrolase|uniref:Mannosylglycerate hydrolase n=1 Tax=Halanaerobium saccharolyticum TaxID=43595 RepID=A0A2T5RH95_9FIRM|nr:glycoside hydrolase family 38 C-terminal domain-containing protein [Halanaerobium saccharolyticum]PTV95040.1 mannosylglycerate hydrolase [Halanaerobium saccharolyticum]
MINAHIISHTHWDREWFLNSKYTTEWLVPFFDSLFEMLEKEQNYRFVLDGQTLMIEDYFNELKKQNKDVEKYKSLIKKYGKENRLILGPYYLQPDWQLISEESIVRNMLIGHQMAKELGNVMKAGWLLDNFGQISQTVQIHKEFNMEGLFLWRGVEMDPDEVQSEFKWKGPDGSELTSIYFLSSYRNAMRLAEYEEMFEDRIVNEVEKIFPYATTSNVLLMNGYDQEMVPDDILPKLRELDLENIRVTQSIPNEYLDAVKSESPELQTLENELYSGRYISVFPGILSARMYLKTMNDKCERELSNHTEVFSSFAWLYGEKYQSQKINNLWKELLKNHPHDSICGVSIDDVHTDMEERFSKVYNGSKKIKNEKLSKLAKLIKTNKFHNADDAIIAFNSHFEDKSAIITLENMNKDINILNSEGVRLPVQNEEDKLHVKLDKTPGLGYETLYTIPEKESESLDELLGKVKVDGNIIENNKLKVNINKNGTIDVFDKVNNKNYKGLGEFVDSADAGDEYNYSYPENDEIISSKNSKATIELIEVGPLKAKVKVDYVMSIPKSLTKDRKYRSQDRRDLPITTYIELNANSSKIEFKTYLKNTVKDHRLRVLFPTEIETQQSYAGTQFDITKHDIIPEKFNNEDIDENLKRIIIGARESEPITIFPQKYFVDINNDDYGLAVLNKGLPEYEILPSKNSIALTLFRSVGWLARGDLLTRVGDAGPIINTPDAQCLREMDFQFALYFHSDNHEKAKVYNEALSYNNDLQLVKTDLHDGILDDKKELIELENGSNLSAVKLSEDKKGIVLRIFNPYTTRVKEKIKVDFKLNKVFELDMEENEKQEIIINNKHSFNLDLKPKKIKTIKLEVDRLKQEVGSQKIYNTKLLKNQDYKKFTSYESEPLIEEKDIQQEKERWESLKNDIEKKKEKAQELKEVLNNKNNTEDSLKKELEYKYHKLIGDIYSDERASLEAELSYILSKKKLLEDKNALKEDERSSKEFESRIRKIGNKLNQARVNKRVYEYIVEYYKHQLTDL